MRPTDPLQTHLKRTSFANGAELANALAARVAGALTAAIEARGRATLAVSGGTTPKNFFIALSNLPIAWNKVTVTLVDERMVPPSNDRSNHRLASLFLLQNHAAEAAFVPLYSSPGDATAMAAAAAGKIDALAPPLDVVVLGMGTDGHTASFFPGGTTLAAVTDPACGQSVMAIEAPGAGEPRLTLTLPRIVDAGLIVLHMEGDEKHSVLTRALEAGDDAEMPVRAVLRHARTAVELFWAP
ncbi:6-phosphogluconolactonase [Hoeflea sp. YIM 152468]|uniref:6-phosphogluconolactonase n=1 Tax=Hoeflea sp. YIM 152468 TaxID=3031759 RepID=UPI0023D9D0B2|nr:6-phosphogluconolactonase [Hoeflea sp. YIM 152468]MDF1610146.1 6-phosphogluconolactonase [Hoeflea sp. YIM 152468]